MKTICFLGECMVELRAKDENTMHQSFAGDVYNSAVYLKRCFGDVSTAIITAVGQDGLSDKMVNRFKSENIEPQFVFKHPSKAPGIYLIETDEKGERSFTYWRSDSAARKVVEFIDDKTLEQLSKADMFFFSGISLAVIEDVAREKFWQVLEKLKLAGVRVVFDPNYRARLWNSASEAKEQFDKAFSMANIALPGVEDFKELYGINSAQGVVEFCQPFQLEELIVKNGPESVVSYSQGALLSHDIVPVTNVVDTTSAGDAFNGVYLGSRLIGQPISESIQLAATAAGTVIQHPGAIAPKQAFIDAMSAANRQ